LLAATRQANPSSGRDRLRVAVPVVATLLERLATRGESVRAHTARLLALLDDYGPQELAAAVAEALARDALGPSAITHILETRRRQRRQKPPIPLALPDRPGVRDLTVTPRPLDTNDALARRDPDDTD
jgi:DNA-binding NarL/FixJ family response regulator